MIDWALIGTLEGRRLTGYVPDAADSESGVTIATGVDLGQMSQAEVKALAIPADLRARLVGYAGRKGAFAAKMLARYPLTISESEADALDAAVQARLVDRLRELYNAAVSAAGRGAWFDGLGDAAQTVLVSVACQYGPGLGDRCPRFWHASVAQDWPAVIAELRAFGDRYSTRRNAEADYLEKALAVA